MQLVCSHCGQVLDISGKRPSFCAYCGQPLPNADGKPASTVVSDHEALTLPPVSPATGDDADPAWVGGYRLLRVLGAGGMGKVYEAQDTATGRRVALKLIAAKYAASPEAVERFRREGRLASSVAHPRCVFVLAADEQAGRPYIVMELMPGDTLEGLLQREGPLPVEKALAKILDVIEGLKEAHRLGVVHRDVKPSNCFVERDGRVKVGDFGLAKSLVSGAHLTNTGSFLGTPLFAAPEQIKGEPIGPHSDVYSVAATLYCLLTGRAPFQGGDSAATLARIVCDPPPPMRSLRPELPEALDKAVLRGLERDRDRRWRNLEEFEAALRPFVPGKRSLVGLDVRFGAFLIDYILLFLPSIGINLLISWLGGEPIQSKALPLLIDLLSFLAYFAVPEAFWGWSLGKRWLGLRVVRASGGERIGLWRSLLRTGVFWGLVNLGTLASLLPLFLGTRDAETTDRIVRLVQSLLDLGRYPLNAVGMGLVVCTMRPRNGYRGLHEWASGTHVIRLPEATARRQLGSRCLELPVSHPEGRPERLGVFDVTGVIRVSVRDALLLGEDHALGRKVFLWLRPQAGGQPVRPERHEVSRSTRPRWLAGGRHGDQLWDAFLVPPGHPLPDVVAADSRLSWADTRYLLTQLAEELIASLADQTMPAILTLDQVWVQADGRLQLLDVPLVQEAPGDGLDLLGDVAALALEGRPRPLDSAPAAIRAPLPQHAAWMLGRLMGARKPYRDVPQFQRDLEATADQPTAVTRPRRLAHLAVQAAFLLLGLGAGWLASIPFLIGRSEVGAWMCLVACPVAWVVWAFLWRGGLSLPLFGLSLVRGDGQPAGRLQCAWRVVLVWAPVTAMLACWIGLGWESYGWNALILLLLNVILALSSPERALHDRLAGTYLVPK
jgi:serine/threonine protein kinase